MNRRSFLKNTSVAATVATAAISPLLAQGAEAATAPLSKNEKPLDTDVLIVGGGTAGVIAAIQAARAGASTILLESGSQLGGTMTTAGVDYPGLFHAYGKQVIAGIGWELVEETVRMGDGRMPDFAPTRGHVMLKINLFLY